MCRKVLKCFFAVYDNSGEKTEFVVNFTCLNGLGRVFGKPDSVPAAHLTETMHPIYDKNGQIGNFVVIPQNRAKPFTSNSAKPAKLS